MHVPRRNYIDTPRDYIPRKLDSPVWYFKLDIYQKWALAFRICNTTLWLFSWAKELMTTFDPQRSSSVEWYTFPLPARFRHLDFEPQEDWNTYLQQSLYAYNIQSHRASGASLLPWCYPASGDIWQHLSNYPTRLTICRDTGHQDKYHIGLYKILCWKKSLFEAEFPRPTEATDATSIRMSDGNQHSTKRTTYS